MGEREREKKRKKKKKRQKERVEKQNTKRERRGGEVGGVHVPVDHVVGVKVHQALQCTMDNGGYFHFLQGLLVNWSREERMGRVWEQGRRGEGEKRSEGREEKRERGLVMLGAPRLEAALGHWIRQTQTHLPAGLRLTADPTHTHTHTHKRPRSVVRRPAWRD